jgi:hypothetical protein
MALTRATTLALAALSALAGCRSLAADEDVPAVLVAPNAAVRAELAEALRAALGQRPIALASDALTRSSVLIIDRAPAGRPPNPDATGRRLEIGAQRFRLVVSGDRCVLVRPTDGWRRPLPTARCRPEKR